MKTILALSPHTDDAELGAGGYIARSVEAGDAVHLVAFSPAVESIPKDFPGDATRTEQHKAAQTLGVPGNRLTVMDYPVRMFSDFRQDILDTLCMLREEIRPDVVLMPAACDCHQDHQVIHQEAIRAFRDCALLGYELPRNHVVEPFRPVCYCPLTETQMSIKRIAVIAYQSQLAKRPRMEEMVWNLALMRGMQAGGRGRFAESYEAYRWIL